MNRAIEVSSIRPVIDSAFNFNHVKDAFNYYAAGNYVGKVIVTMP